jgi:hypothetical protein
LAGLRYVPCLEVVGLLAGTAAGIKAAVVAFLLSETLRELIEYRSRR